MFFIMFNSFVFRWPMTEMCRKPGTSFCFLKITIVFQIRKQGNKKASPLPFFKPQISYKYVAWRNLGLEASNFWEKKESKFPKPERSKDAGSKLLSLRYEFNPFVSSGHLYLEKLASWICMYCTKVKFRVDFFGTHLFKDTDPALYPFINTVSQNFRASNLNFPLVIHKLALTAETSSFLHIFQAAELLDTDTWDIFPTPTGAAESIEGDAS